MDNQNKNEAANSNGTLNDHLEMMSKVSFTKYDIKKLLTYAHPSLDDLEEMIEDQQNNILYETTNTFCMTCISEITEQGMRTKRIYDALLEMTAMIEEAESDQEITNNLKGITNE